MVTSVQNIIYFVTHELQISKLCTCMHQYLVLSLTSVKFARDNDRVLGLTTLCYT